MTVQAKVTHTKSVMLSPQLYARWEAYQAKEGVSFNGLIIAFLERCLPVLEESKQEERP